MFDETSFVENGYFTYEFQCTDALSRAKLLCTQLCKEQFGDEFSSLASYHNLDISRETHDNFQFKLYQALNELKLHHEFAKENVEFFKILFGPDIDIQTHTYLRIARPNNAQDNIGLHRDTDYGNSAYEVSLSLPLIDQDPGSGLCVVPRSHLSEEYITKQINRSDVKKGTNKNEMGFLYAPKIPQNLNVEQVECVSLPFGSGLGFTLGLIHGQTCNTSLMTRWCIDFRIKCSYSPVSINLKSGYYSPLVRGAVSKVSEGYYQKNKREYDELISSLNKA